MKALCVSALAASLALAGCETSSNTVSAAPAAAAGQPVAQADMGNYCRAQAATRFGQRPEDILTLPIEQSAGSYNVYGQWPASGNAAGNFLCEFNAGGVFVGVSQT